MRMFINVCYIIPIQTKFDWKIIPAHLELIDRYYTLHSPDRTEIKHIFSHYAVHCCIFENIFADSFYIYSYFYKS